MPKGVIVDEEGVMAGYADVRDDESETKFLMLTYQDENTKIGYVLFSGCFFFRLTWFQIRLISFLISAQSEYRVHFLTSRITYDKLKLPRQIMFHRHRLPSLIDYYSTPDRTLYNY